MSLSLDFMRGMTDMRPDDELLEIVHVGERGSGMSLAALDLMNAGGDE